MLPAATLWLALAAPGGLHAADHDAFNHEGMMPHHFHDLIGLKLIGLASIPHGEPEFAVPQWGFGGIYERTLVPEHLELENSINFLVAPDGLHIPIDIILKKPFHVSHIVDPYIGFGPSLTIGLGAEKFAGPGILATGGLYVWARERMGLMFDLDYGVVLERGELFHEIEATAGAVYRF